MKKGLVISGGGSKGAWAGGVIDYLVSEKQYDWNVVFGTSTGGLLAPLASLGETKRLKDAYTNVNDTDIFSIRPFNSIGKIRVLNAIWRILNNKISLGDAGKLEQLIKKFFTEEDYHKTLDRNKTVCCVVTNFTSGDTEYKYQNKIDYDNFCDWMKATSAVPIVFDPYINVLNNLYLDGGVTIHVPIQEAIHNQCDEIDIIILRPEKHNSDYWTGHNMWDVLQRTLDLMLESISIHDVIVGQLEGELDNIKLNFYYTPYNLTDNSAVFNKEQMIKWWNEGYEFAKDNTPKTLLLAKKETIFSAKTNTHVNKYQII